MKKMLFPQPHRYVPAGRWVRILLRTWHLASMAFLVGAVAQGAALHSLSGALWGLVLSGGIYVAVELYTSCVFMLQLKGLAVVAKFLLMGAASAHPENAVPYLLVAIIIGGISSHMSGRYRYYSIFHGRVVKE